MEKSMINQAIEDFSALKLKFNTEYAALKLKYGYAPQITGTDAIKFNYNYDEMLSVSGNAIPNSEHNTRSEIVTVSPL